MDVNEIISEAIRLIKDQYVFPDIGEQVSTLLARNLGSGRYTSVTEPGELATLVTEDVQSFNGDKHFRLVYRADGYPDLPGESLTVAQMAEEAAACMNGIPKIAHLPGNIALVEFAPAVFPTSIAGGSVAAAMNLVAPAGSLIIDLRDNHGGDPQVIALICSYLFDGEPVHLLNMYTRATDRTDQSWTLPYVPGPRFGGEKPVRVLTSAQTFSGGEELAYDLQQLGRALIVGERTGGGAHPQDGFRLHPQLKLTVPVARAIGPLSGTNWEGTGVSPDIEVPADQALDAALADLKSAAVPA